jgi:deoxyribose-phosphate aldolase
MIYLLSPISCEFLDFVCLYRAVVPLLFCLLRDMLIHLFICASLHFPLGDFENNQSQCCKTVKNSRREHN